MPPVKNEQEEFLKDLEPKEGNTVLEQPLAPEAEKPTEEEKPETAEEKSNRKERRLQQKYQAERESSIALAARLEALTEAQKLRADTEPSEYLKQVEKIYGTNSPEAAEATELLKTALKGVEERAVERAYERIRDEQEAERNAVRDEEKTLDSMVDDIEDQFGVVMDENTQQGFYQLLEKLSPKDRDGNIIEYADPIAVYEELQTRRQPTTNRAKDLASRSMVRTGSSPQTTVESEAAERFLREQGII